MTRLLLASASRARLSTLRSAGIEPIIQASHVDEDAALAEATARFGPPSSADTALILARAKAEAVAASTTAEALVLGCDSVLEFDGQVRGKPADAAEAALWWFSMRGRTGTLHTGHWLIDRRNRDDGNAPPHEPVGATQSTVIHFADVSEAEINAYVGTGEPLRVAGAFTVDGYGGPFITSIDGDYHNVVGLSLPLLRELLTQLGFTIADLWRIPSP